MFTESLFSVKHEPKILWHFLGRRSDFGGALTSFPLLIIKKLTKVLLASRIALVLFYYGELHFLIPAIPALSDEVA